MSSGPAPSFTTSRIYSLTATGTPGQYTIASASSLTYVNQDTTTSAGDDLSILGDIPNDTFTSTRSGTAPFVVNYVGRTGLADEVIGINGGSTVLLSSNVYTVGTTITSIPGAYPVCFCSGTTIRTAPGDTIVEDLRVGDLVVTSSGEHRPIRWIGHRTITCGRHPDPANVLPVRIVAGALGKNKPERDLLVSPGHAICLDILGEVLIPASALINGTTITQEQVEEVTYWHVELDSHDILIANGQPAESYLDVGNRTFFTESGVVDLSALPNAGPAARTHADYCRPCHDVGPLVDAVRAQMRRRAEALGWKLEQAATWAGVHLAVDGQIIEPKVRGLSGCFEVPADAQDVWLVSPTSVPRHVSDSSDSRALGLCLKGLRLDDGLSDTKVVLHDDPLLDEVFHAAASDHRWTPGRARLPSALFTGMEGTVLLRLDLNAPALPRWTASEATVETHKQQPEGLKLVKAA